MRFLRGHKKYIKDNISGNEGGIETEVLAIYRMLSLTQCDFEHEDMFFKNHRYLQNECSHHNSKGFLANLILRPLELEPDLMYKKTMKHPAYDYKTSSFVKQHFCEKCEFMNLAMDQKYRYLFSKGDQNKELRVYLIQKGVLEKGEILEVKRKEDERDMFKGSDVYGYIFTEEDKAEVFEYNRDYLLKVMLKNFLVEEGKGKILNEGN